MENTKIIIKKWYDRLGFPEKYNEEFIEALEKIEIPHGITPDTYDRKSTDGKRNLLTFLYFAELLEEKYKNLGIPEDILIDTLRDIPRWTEIWSGVKGELYLGELDWLYHHMSLKIFKVGRLQYYLGKASADIDSLGVKKGDCVLDIHIPRDGKLTPSECERSLAMAREFFPKHFPEHDFKCFSCHSWLLDSTLKKYLPEGSNIIKFGDMFTRIHDDVCFDLVKYMFTWDTTKDNLSEKTAKNPTAQIIKDAVLGGEVFHATLGVIAL